MIISNKNQPAQTLVGKQIESVYTSEQVTFPKRENTLHDEEGSLVDQIEIKFTDGTKVLLAVRTSKTHLHDGSGGASIIFEADVPHIDVSVK